MSVHKSRALHRSCERESKPERWEGDGEEKSPEVNSFILIIIIIMLIILRRPIRCAPRGRAGRPAGQPASQASPALALGGRIRVCLSLSRSAFFRRGGRDWRSCGAGAPWPAIGRLVLPLPPFLPPPPPPPPPSLPSALQQRRAAEPSNPPPPFFVHAKGRIGSPRLSRKREGVTPPRRLQRIGTDFSPPSFPAARTSPPSLHLPPPLPVHLPSLPPARWPPPLLGSPFPPAPVPILSPPPPAPAAPNPSLPSPLSR